MNIIPEIALFMNCIDEPIKIRQPCVADLVTKYLDYPATELELIDLSCLADVIQISISLPEEVSIEFYLSLSPDKQRLHVTVHGLHSRTQSTKVNQDLASWMQQEECELALYDIFQKAKTMCQDSVASSNQESSSDTTVSVADARYDSSHTPGTSASQKSCYSRVMFYAHHLLATSKRHDLKRLAATLELHVVIKVGYPGLIAAEGELSSIEQFKQDIRRMKWHTIALRYDLHKDLDDRQTWLDHAILQEQFLETDRMEDVAAYLKDDRAWFMSIMH